MFSQSRKAQPLIACALTTALALGQPGLAHTRANTTPRALGHTVMNRTLPKPAHSIRSAIAPAHTCRCLDPTGDASTLVYFFNGQGVLVNVSASYSYQEGHIYDLSTGHVVGNVPNYQNGGTDIYDLSENWIGEIENSVS